MAVDYEGRGRQSWARTEPQWGIWGIPEAELQVLPEVAGLDTIELGCGTGYVSAWLARAGARPVGIDNSAAQLTNARRFQVEFGIDFPLLHGNAETVPYPDASFDLAISEYGACLWADPGAWVPEAARLLRPRGQLIFLTNAATLMLCSPDDENEPAADRLLRPYFGWYRWEWPDDDSVEFHLSHGDWVRLLRASGFEIDDLIEVQAPSDATTSYPFVTADWASRWPSEEIWKARKRA
jgi:SAM-dependent methyltransferase